jgi:hypothetical protein
MQYRNDELESDMFDTGNDCRNWQQQTKFRKTTAMHVLGQTDQNPAPSKSATADLHNNL